MEGYNGLKVALQASNGQYVCAERGGGYELVANRDAIGPWETFTLYPAARRQEDSFHNRVYFSYDNLHLKADTQFWSYVDEFSPHQLVANRDRAEEWETFHLHFVDQYRDEILQGRRMSLIPTGDFVGAAVDWKDAWRNDSDRYGNRDDLARLGIRDGRFVALTTYWSTFVTAERGGGYELVADRDQLGPWEIFTLRVLSLPSEIYPPRDERLSKFPDPSMHSR